MYVVYCYVFVYKNWNYIINTQVISCSYIIYIQRKSDHLKELFLSSIKDFGNYLRWKLFPKIANTLMLLTVFAKKLQNVRKVPAIYLCILKTLELFPCHWWNCTVNCVIKISPSSHCLITSSTCFRRILHAVLLNLFTFTLFQLSMFTWWW